MPVGPAPFHQDVATTFTGAVLYGLYLTTLVYAYRWMLFTDEGWKIRKRIQWLMVTASSLIFALSTINIACVLRTSMDEVHFLELGNKSEDYIDPPWDAIVQCATADLVALLADCILMYRCWVVYGKKLQIIYFPIFLWLGGIVCAILQTFLQIKHINDKDFGPYKWASVNMEVGPGIALAPFWASTIVLNAYCTFVLVWRIWRAAHKSESGEVARQLRFIIRVLLESGAIYLAISLAHFLVWFGKDIIAIHMLGTVNTVVISIAFNLVLIRTSSNRVHVDAREYSDDRLSTMDFSTRPTITIEYQTSQEKVTKGTTGTRESDPTLYGRNGSHSSV